MPVKSPTTKTTLWPASWKWRILRRTTVCPRWMSGAEGSNPTLTVRGPRAILRTRSSSSIKSTTPRRRISSSGGREVTAGQDYTWRRLIPSLRAAKVGMEIRLGDISSPWRYKREVEASSPVSPGGPVHVVAVGPAALRGDGNAAGGGVGDGSGRGAVRIGREGV